MEIQAQIKTLAERIIALKDQISTEEATKTAFILPFINLLGYDIFNPTEVIPEFTADIGLKKGEKVDYAVFQNGNPILIIECKHCHENLDAHNSQLIRYFHVSKSRFALLTNGIEYRFFTDLEKSNIMDNKPFLEFDMTNLRDSQINELAKFHKNNFDVDKIVNNASSLKYGREIKRIFNLELAETTDEFTRFFASRVYNGRLTEKVMSEFKEIVHKSINQMISERVNDRLKSALHTEAEQQEEENPEPLEESKIITTEEELDGFRIIVAILRRKLALERIVYRDTQSYFGVLLDDNNRKPLCRLHLNSTKKYIGLFNEDKHETRILIDSVNNIYEHEKALLNTAGYYE
ncbi:MAG: restriction endonuclease [Crocinitomix sp.]|nr:restriction endonuclease [Crocinitomix sp.]